MTISAAQYLGMRAMFGRALAANSPLYANPSDGEVLSFFGQLATEAAGAPALAAAQQAAIGYAFRGLLSGNFSGIANPNDAQVLDFWAQLSTDSSGASALSVPRYQTLKQTLLDQLALNYPGTTNPSLLQLLGYIAAVAGFNLASLFPGAYQVFQSDRGLTYGGTPLAAAGNTSTTVLTLTGTLATTPVPIRVKATNSAAVSAGASFDVSFDAGSTFPITGITPIAGVPVAFTGAGAGLSITWSAGNGVINDTWNATCSALADQTSNGAHATQASAALQPVVGVGLNGKPSLVFDGSDDYLTTAALSIPVGAMLYMVYRYKAAGAGAYVTDGIPADRMHIQILAGPNTEMYNGASLAGSGVFGGVNIYGRLAATFNGASSSIKVGSTGLVSGNSGASAAGTGRNIGISGALTLPSNIEMLALAWAPPIALTAPDNAINSSIGYGLGAIVV